MHIVVTGRASRRFTETSSSQISQIPKVPFYRALAQVGLQYGPAFSGLDGIWRTEGEAFARIPLDDPAFCIDPRSLDAAFQVVGAAAGIASSGDNDLWVPLGFDRMVALMAGVEHIRSQSAGSLGRRVSNRADGDADERMRTSGALQLLDPAACCSPFRRLQSLLQIQFNRQIGPARGNHVTESTRGLFIEPIPRTLNSHLLFGCLHLGAHERI